MKPTEYLFMYDIPTIYIGEELGVYKDFLEITNQELQIVNNAKWDLDYDTGLDIYNEETHDLTIKLISEDEEYTIRFNDYIKIEAYDFEEECYRNFRLLIQILNKYLLEKNRIERVIVTKESEYDIWIDLTKDEKSIKKAQDDYFENGIMIYKTSTIKNLLQKYEKNKVFDLLEKNIKLKGEILSMEYNYPTIIQDLLWFYKDLVVVSCPRESNGYETELKKLLKSTNQEIKYSNFEEKKLNGMTEISCLLNDKPFLASNLPEYYNFRFIKKLNAHLEKEYGTSFYIWHWERSPARQLSFIYSKISTYNQYWRGESGLREFDLLSEDVIDFYKKNR